MPFVPEEEYLIQIDQVEVILLQNCCILIWSSFNKVVHTKKDMQIVRENLHYNQIILTSKNCQPGKKFPKFLGHKCTNPLNTLKEYV
jgi:hypothetical protein